MTLKQATYWTLVQQSIIDTKYKKDNTMQSDYMSNVDTYVPLHMRDGLKLYLENGIEPGSFMAAVLCNDLKEAFGRADHINIKHIGTIVCWLFNHAPSTCWGSTDNYTAWIKHGGTKGKE